MAWKTGMVGQSDRVRSQLVCKPVSSRKILAALDYRARRIADSYYVEACSKTSTMKTRRQMRSTCQERHTFQDSIHACDVDPGHCPMDRYIMLSGWLSQVSIRTIWASSSSSGLLQLIWHQSFDGAAPLACTWCRQSWVQFLTK